MYSKEETKKLKKEFWTSFSEEYPRKWILYNTKVKDLSFKFSLNNKSIEVAFEIECNDLEKRTIYFEKVESLKLILTEEYLPDVIFEKNYTLDTQKEISRIWVEKKGLTFKNKNNWQEIFDFFYEKMDAFERFYFEYEDYIKDLDINL